MSEIYLCDEDPLWLRRMERTVNRFQVKSDWDTAVVCRARSPQELLAVMKSRSTKSGIYFLDVEYGARMDGVALGAEIRSLDIDAFLIYVTAHENMALDVFHLKLLALDFIVKTSEDCHDKIFQSLEYIEQKLARGEAGPNTLVLNIGSSYKFFLKKDIYFIEAEKNSRGITLHTVSGIHHYPVTIRECASRLHKDFLLCRKGCLVNLWHIQSADRADRTILLDNGERCLCSVRQWDVLIRLYSRQD